MRVVHVSPSLDTSGLPRMVQTIANGLVAAGHEVTVVAPPGDLLRELSAKHVPIDADMGAMSLVRLGGTLLNLIGQTRPQILHVHHRRHALVAGVVARGSGTVVVEHVHSCFSDKKLLSFRSPHLVAVGSAVARNIVDVYKRPAERISVIPNAVDDQAGGGLAPTPTSTLRLVAVGRLSSEKDPQYFNELVGHIREVVPEVQATWVGDGPLWPKVHNWSNVNWVGQKSQEEIGAEIRRSHALVITSVLEGLPLVALQALALGKPVLSRQVGSIEDAVLTPETGAVWPRDADPSAAAKFLGLGGFLSVPTLAAMQLASRQRYLDCFSVEALIARLIGAYSGLVEPGSLKTPESAGRISSGTRGMLRADQDGASMEFQSKAGGGKLETLYRLLRAR